jgi:hypothetical protein
MAFTAFVLALFLGALCTLFVAARRIDRAVRRGRAKGP